MEHANEKQVNLEAGEATESEDNASSQMEYEEGEIMNSSKDVNENSEESLDGKKDLPAEESLDVNNSGSSSIPVEQPDAVTSSNVDPRIIERLTQGIMERFLPSLRKSQTTVDQIKSSQEVMLETVSQEISKFKDCSNAKDVEDTMVKARQYHNKLLRLRKEMTGLYDKSKKLKKRALKLQQQKQTAELTRAHDREHEMEKERMLTARVASPNS